LLLLAKDLGYVEDVDCNEAGERVVAVKQMLSGLLSQVRSSSG